MGAMSLRDLAENAPALKVAAPAVLETETTEEDAAEHDSEWAEARLTDASVEVCLHFRTGNPESMST